MYSILFSLARLECYPNHYRVNDTHVSITADVVVVVVVVAGEKEMLQRFVCEPARASYWWLF